MPRTFVWHPGRGPKRTAKLPAATGAKRSRPWKVVLVVGRKREEFSMEKNCGAPASSPADAGGVLAAASGGRQRDAAGSAGETPAFHSVNNPLSGARNTRPSFSAATIRRAVPTPGSTTHTKIVPSGHHRAAVARNHAPSSTSNGAISCVRSNTGTEVRDASTPFIAAT